MIDNFYLASHAEELMQTKAGRIGFSLFFTIGIFSNLFIDIRYWIALAKRKKRMHVKKTPHRRGGVPSKTYPRRLNFILYVFFVIWGFAWLSLLIQTIFFEWQA